MFEARLTFVNRAVRTVNGTNLALSAEKSGCGQRGGRLAVPNEQARIFRYFKTSPEIIRLAVMMHVR